jgi:hypothetical protein
LESLDDKPLEQKSLIAIVMTLPAATLEDEMRQRNAVINAVTAYYKVEKGGYGLPSWKRGSTYATSTIVKVEEDTRPLVATVGVGRRWFGSSLFLCMYIEVKEKKEERSPVL